MLAFFCSALHSQLRSFAFRAITSEEAHIGVSPPYTAKNVKNESQSSHLIQLSIVDIALYNMDIMLYAQLFGVLAFLGCIYEAFYFQFVQCILWSLIITNFMIYEVVLSIGIVSFFVLLYYLLDKGMRMLHMDK